MSALKDLQDFLAERYDTIDGEGACDRPSGNDWMKAGLLLEAVEREQKKQDAYADHLKRGLQAIATYHRNEAAAWRQGPVLCPECDADRADYHDEYAETAEKLLASTPQMGGVPKMFATTVEEVAAEEARQAAESLPASVEPGHPCAGFIPSVDPSRCICGVKIERHAVNRSEEKS